MSHASSPSPRSLLNRCNRVSCLIPVTPLPSPQLKEMHSWLQSIESLLESLGGVRVLDSSESKLVLALTTLVGCGDDVARGLVSATEPARVHHTLTVALEGGVPVAAEANPPIAGLEAAVEAAREGPHGVDFVVGEARRLVCAASAGSES